jgi:hypothetical protein
MIAPVRSDLGRHPRLGFDNLNQCPTTYRSARFGITFCSCPHRQVELRLDVCHFFARLPLVGRAATKSIQAWGVNPEPN